MEEPVGRAGGRRNDRSVGAKQSGDGVEDLEVLVCLQRNEHIVLRAEARGIVGRGQAHGEILTRRDQAQPVALDRRQMRAARDQAHLDSRHTRQMRA